MPHQFENCLVRSLLIAHTGMMEMWPSRCVALAKRSLQYMLPFGLAATLTGTVFVDRGNRERALGTMGDTAVAIKQNKVSYSCLSDTHTHCQTQNNENHAGKEKGTHCQTKQRRGK